MGKKLVSCHFAWENIYKWRTELERMKRPRGNVYLVPDSTAPDTPLPTCLPLSPRSPRGQGIAEIVVQEKVRARGMFCFHTRARGGCGESQLKEQRFHLELAYSSGCDRRERTVRSVLHGRSVLFYHNHFCHDPRDGVGLVLKLWKLL